MTLPALPGFALQSALTRCINRQDPFLAAKKHVGTQLANKALQRGIKHSLRPGKKKGRQSNPSLHDHGVKHMRPSSSSMAPYEGVQTCTAKQIADSIRDGEGVVVIHCLHYDGNGTYNFSDPEGGSELTEDLPAEATDPAVCGVLRGVLTGSGRSWGRPD